MKKALIFGVTGQDGSYLAELLYGKGYSVFAVARASSVDNLTRIRNLLTLDSESGSGRVEIVYGDVTDSSSVINIINRVKPDEIYNLAAQSHVGRSFEIPVLTGDVDGLGTTRILEGIRTLGLSDSTRYYQASTSELYGAVVETPQNESTPFNPQSPYAIAKLYAFWITKCYREAYGLFACNGILFNHESARRSNHFVTRKITYGLSRIALGLDVVLELGNLDAMRDWGHARDYVEMQWLMLQYAYPDDYVISTGVQHSVRDFIEWTSAHLGFTIRYEGKGINEVGIVDKIFDQKKAPALRVGLCILKINKRHFRPADVSTLLGDSTKAGSRLGWKPKYTARDVCQEMVAHDYNLALKEIEK